MSPDMLQSVDRLLLEVTGPLRERCGPQARVLTTEVHGDEVRGLVFCPGKVLRYVPVSYTHLTLPTTEYV